jgi:probable F420-dependent oxidoreductase
MQIGVVFPQTEIGADPGSVRDHAQAAEALGFDYLLAFDHVLGANAATHGDLTGPYRHHHLFHEPFTLFGYLAGITTRIGFATGVVILPQRQTALVAKQAAEVDVLSGGRLRLGIGIGWNPVEYEALGEDFSNRGRRSEEQVAVMRRLWTEELVTFEGRWHRIGDAGLNPMPIQRPIPVWFGGAAEAVLQRCAKLGDGWMIPTRIGLDKAPERIERLRNYARQAGRDPAAIGLETWVNAADGSPTQWAETAGRWREAGATHLSINTMGAGFDRVDRHIDAIRRFKEAVAGV